jgi:hypothetical protein
VLKATGIILRLNGTNRRIDSCFIVENRAFLKFRPLAKFVQNRSIRPWLSLATAQETGATHNIMARNSQYLAFLSPSCDIYAVEAAA